MSGPAKVAVNDDVNATNENRIARRNPNQLRNGFRHEVRQQGDAPSRPRGRGLDLGRRGPQDDSPPRRRPVQGGAERSRLHFPVESQEIPLLGGNIGGEIGARVQAKLHLRDPDGGEIAGGRRTHAHRDVGLPPFKRGLPRLTDEADLESRVFPPEGGQRSRQARRRESGRRADDDRSGDLVARSLGDHQRGLRLRRHALGVERHASSRLGRNEAPPATVDEARSQSLLQRRDPSRDRRVLHAQRPRGGRQGSLGDKRLKMAEIFPIDTHPATLRLCEISQSMMIFREFSIKSGRAILVADKGFKEDGAMDLRVRVTTPGGVEVLAIEEHAPERPGPGEIRVRQRVIGVNFIDIYHRTGLYPLPAPGIPGVEGAGVVEGVGEGVSDLAPGDRVAYGCLAGGYASTRILPAWRAARIPDDVSDEVAASALTRGLTTRMLTTRVFPVGPGSLVLVLSAAGGLGQSLTRRVVASGGEVIGVVGSASKAERAREAGARHVIVGRDADLSAETARLTDGRGVDFAVDGVGGSTLARTLGCVRRFGVVASVGQAGGPIPPIDVRDLGPARSLFFVRPSVMAYAAERETYPEAARAELEAVRGGGAIGIGATFPLVEAARAQGELESGRTTGATVLIP